MRILLFASNKVRFSRDEASITTTRLLQKKKIYWYQHVEYFCHPLYMTLRLSYYCRTTIGNVVYSIYKTHEYGNVMQQS